MNTKKMNINYSIQSGIPFLIVIFLLSACNQSSTSQEKAASSSKNSISPSRETSFPETVNLIEVKTEYMNFIMPDKIPSGWNTFRYANESNLTHFMSFDKLPIYEGEQKTLHDFEEVAVIFQDAMDLINAGKNEEAYAEFAKFPAWNADMVFMGGVGLVSPGETAQTTVYLEPGEYVVECYVKTAGKFHPMAKQITVLREASQASAPEPTVNITVSKKGGISVDREPIPGLHTVAVHFADQALHEHFLGHDVHLARLDNLTDIDSLNSWMNWSVPGGLETPAPATFVGGTQQMPEGNTAYFTVNLEPGRYAWIAEVPNPLSKNMLKTFEVPTKLATTE